MSHLHSLNIAHRDLKPENILMKSKDETNFKLKICDFGFAKKADTDGGLTSPDHTPFYVPPEVLLRNFRRYDISCDIWSLGVILYILVSGKFPFFPSEGDSMTPGTLFFQYRK